VYGNNQFPIDGRSQQRPEVPLPLTRSSPAQVVSNGPVSIQRHRRSLHMIPISTVPDPKATHPTVFHAPAPKGYRQSRFRSGPGSASIPRKPYRSRPYGWRSAVVLLMTCTLGCSIEWGGAEFALSGPPEKNALAGTPEGTVMAEVDLPDPPEGDLLLVGESVVGGIRLEVVGEVRGDSLFPVPSEAEAPGISTVLGRSALASGTNWALFSDGAVVGIMVADSLVGPGSECSGLPRLIGTPLVVDGAWERGRVIARPMRLEAAGVLRTNEVMAHNYDQRVASLSFARQAIFAENAPFPEEGVLPARKEIGLVRLNGRGAAPFLVATFAIRDSVAMVPSVENAYSVFVMGSQRGESFYRAYSRLRRTEDGKGVMRYLDRVDLGQDGRDEVLTEVIGEDSHWFALISEQAGEWQLAFETPCGVPD